MQILSEVWRLKGLWVHTVRRTLPPVKAHDGLSRDKEGESAGLKKWQPEGNRWRDLITKQL